MQKIVTVSAAVTSESGGGVVRHSLHPPVCAAVQSRLTSGYQPCSPSMHVIRPHARTTQPTHILYSSLSLPVFPGFAPISQSVIAYGTVQPSSINSARCCTIDCTYVRPRLADVRTRTTQVNSLWQPHIR